ncbi:methyltransferase [Microcystis phage Mae-JY35]
MDMLVDIPEGRSGPWSVERFEVDKSSVALMRLSFEGRGCRPGTYTRLNHASRGVVMSDTPAEQRDHMGFIHRARGHVLINGLGIGMCLRAVLRKLEVSAVTVVEVDPEVIALVGPHYSDPRLEIVNASAFDYQPPKGVRYGAVWHDIWDTICADNLPEMHRLHRKYGRRADWQGSWCRWECERNR